MDNLFTQKVINVNNLFRDSFLDSKTLYLYCFNELPSISFINGIDGEKTYNELKSRLETKIRSVHATDNFQIKRKKFGFDTTLIILHDYCVIELDDYYCEILHNGKQQELIELITGIAVKYRKKERKQPLEINLIVNGNNRLRLQSMEIKKVKLDLDLYYEDDFKMIDDTIQNRLKKDGEKGIVLLHGLPGTGKTTYLRYLIGRIKKRILFVSPSVASNLMDPQFIELLIENPNTVLIIEDAENIIMDRKFSNSSSVSNLLNISDGLLADFLNVQIICTFNSALTTIDSALLRKGRLIARYEFGKLSVSKAKRLNDVLGLKQVIDKPMTIAEITNPNEITDRGERKEIIGFRKHDSVLN